MAAQKKLPPEVETAIEPSPIAPGKSVGVVRLPTGDWVARIYAIRPDGTATIEKESQPDLRAVAIERMHVYTAQLFLL